MNLGLRSLTRVQVAVWSANPTSAEDLQHPRWRTGSPETAFRSSNPVYGQQEQSAYNGHFESTCYHPLLLFNREGDCLAGKLRPLGFSREAPMAPSVARGSTLHCKPD
jgi:hypothetical protein